MKQIQIHSFLSTGINPEFDKIMTIDIESKPFAEGGFGEVYHCLAINGNRLKTSQVIKIFKEAFPGSMDDNLRTIQRLQKKISQYGKDLHAQGKSLLQEYPAFLGLPQFSFTGYINGSLVKGFSADNLADHGYVEFDKLLSDRKLRDKFYDIPVERRIYFAYQLVSAFKVLDEFKYIHADLKPGAIFLNLDTQGLAIIDYDSGVITETDQDEPKTWGAIGDWVAPEIYKQLGTAQKGEKIDVDIFTDRWSVAIGVNYFISGIHPLFYLAELAPKVTDNYFNQTQWPNADVYANYFCKDNEQFYNQYVDFIKTRIPPLIKDKMAYTINFGYKNPAARTTYKDWQNALKSIQQPPQIKSFIVSKTEIIEGESVVVAWNAENTVSVRIDGMPGILGGIDKKSVKPQTSTTYKIVFRGYYGEITEQIHVKVFPAPKFKILKSEEPKIKKGKSTNLIWEIENAMDIKLSGVEKNPIQVSKTEKQLITPQKTSSYKFEVTALDGVSKFEKFVTVEVFEEGKIKFFKTDKQYAFPTIPVNLSWKVENALEVEIEGVGKFQLSGQVAVYPQVDTTYKLKVTDNFGVITETVQVKMLPLPVIKEVLIPTPIVKTQSIINISLPAFSSNSSTFQKVTGLKKTIIIHDVNTENLAQVKAVELEYDIKKFSFLERAKRVISIIKKEFINKKNKRYVTAK